MQNKLQSRTAMVMGDYFIEWIIFLRSIEISWDCRCEHAELPSILRKAVQIAIPA